MKTSSGGPSVAQLWAGWSQRGEVTHLSGGFGKRVLSGVRPQVPGRHVSAWVAYSGDRKLSYRAYPKNRYVRRQKSPGKVEDQATSLIATAQAWPAHLATLVFRETHVPTAWPPCGATGGFFPSSNIAR
ncbi:hypothetical protein [Flexibacterium corallicola]|uniref:hypothetical protein n=1 Tax=Flexibacterium corallicola TaxID=3037259 RepID=UPI00286F3AB9|nr:hypothetical protein [Pseudovibrio sp. M1P-2-3]